MVILLGLLLSLQGEAPKQQLDEPTATTVRATRAAVAPVIDGLDNDAIWRAAPVIDQFLESAPSEGAQPKVRTEARVAYDAHNLYVFVRALDPHPDSIVSLLARRDEMPPSDHVTLLVDSYHDRRTGFEFSVNPAGVKADYAIFNDGNEDQAWDAVWDAATVTDSLGYTVEFKIPLSQLKYSRTGDGTFGILIYRMVERYTETVTWPLLHTSKSGLASQFGVVTGLDSLGSPGRAEFAPYIVAKNTSGTPAQNFGRDQDFTAGGDLKYRVASNLLVNASVNPDFGQVEADPSVLNLGAFETFFDERRPFFVEGKGLFNFPVNCVVVVDCNTGEGLFYSRRIGRSPQLAGQYGDASSPSATRIWGAAKLTGRMPGGFSIGFLDAVTDHVSGPPGTRTTLEPATNYGVLRLNQDFHNGEGNVGVIVTGVNRSLDASSEPYLHSSAYSAGIDARKRFNGRFEISGSFDASRVGGSREALDSTQTDAVHLYQRPDGPLSYDTTRTSLTGTNMEFRFAKVGGKRLLFETAYQRRSAGFEVNDIGFLRQADQQVFSNWANLAFRTPNKVFQQLRWNFNNWEYWTAAGLPTEVAFNTNVHTQLSNRWWFHLGGTLGQLGTTYCDRCARGGPAIRQDPYISPWAGIQGDDRHALVPYFWVNYFNGDGGRSHNISLQPELDLKVSSRFTTSLSANWDRNTNDTQFFGTFDTLGTHYTFAHLEQKTLSLTFRLGYTFTPNTSLQVYASPYISKGTYTDVRELGDPRASAYDARYQPYFDASVAGNPGGFNFQQFRSNVVFRWEYRPGSTLFLVWSQGRQGNQDIEGTRGFGGNFNNLFGQRAEDTFLIKVSYWFAR